MTEHHFDIPGVEGGRTYLLEINPNYVFRTTEDKKNVIDARWIDTSSGLFIDITAVRPDEKKRKNGDSGALMCKDNHKFDVSGLRSRSHSSRADLHYKENDIFPLRNSHFEDFPVKIPFAYTKLLVEEYGTKSLTATTFQEYVPTRCIMCLHR
jgi:hypothetical protein